MWVTPEHTLNRKRNYFRGWKRKLKLKVFEHYEKACACCGEHRPQFLAIDHINNDGSTHRKELNMRGGGSFYQWLKSHGFPEGFQTLCHNCNQAKGVYGKCPHETEKLNRQENV